MIVARCSWQYFSELKKYSNYIFLPSIIFHLSFIIYHLSTLSLYYGELLYSMAVKS